VAARGREDGGACTVWRAAADIGVDEMLEMLLCALRPVYIMNQHDRQLDLDDFE